jgi:hypothetical protein|nr:hypothetical protein [Kofleriaceae bacterium]
MKAVVAVVCAVAAACGGAPAAGGAAGACRAGPVVLQIPYAPPRRGEVLHYAIHGTSTLTHDGKTDTARFEFATREVTADVDGDVAAAVDVTFERGHFERFKDGAVAATDVTGTFHVTPGTGSASAQVFERDGHVADGELAEALDGYTRHDVGHVHWLLSLLTDRTYVAGVETHLRDTDAVDEDGQPLDARITLVGVDRGLATFRLAMRHSLNRVPFDHDIDAVVDVRRARLVSTRVSVHVDAAVAARAKLDMSATGDEQFRYDDAQPTAIADSRAPCAGSAAPLFVASTPPRVGDTFELADRMDLSLRLTVTGREIDTVGSHDVEVHGRVDAVEDGAMTGLALTVDTARSHLASGSTAPTDHQEAAGTVWRADYVPPGVRYQRGGAGVPLADVSLADAPLLLTALQSGIQVVPWATQLVVDRSYQVGVEQRFRAELLPGLATGRVQVRAMLVDATPGHATFQVGIDAPLPELPKVSLVLRGKLELDLATGHASHLALTARIEHLPDSIEAESTWTLEQQLVYHRAP